MSQNISVDIQAIRSFQADLTENEKIMENMWVDLEALLPKEKRKYFADHFAAVVTRSEDLQDRMDGLIRTAESYQQELLKNSMQNTALPMDILKQHYKAKALKTISYPSTPWKVDLMELLGFFEKEVAPIDSITAIIAFGSAVMPLEKVKQIKKRFVFFGTESVTEKYLWKTPNDLDLLIISDQIPSQHVKKVASDDGYTVKVQDVLNIKRPAKKEGRQSEGYGSYSIIHEDVPDKLHILSMTIEQLEALGADPLYVHILNHGVLVAGDFPHQMQEKVLAIWDTTNRVSCNILCES